jgi:UPF0716 protein FxsA
MLVLALLALPLVEIAVFVAVGLAAGWLVAVALLLGTSVLGVLVLRAESRTALRRVTTAVAQNRPPGPKLVYAALGVVGGALLVIPGFVTDALAVPLLLPPTRRLIGRHLSRRVAQRATRFATMAERLGRPGVGRARGRRRRDGDRRRAAPAGPLKTYSAGAQPGPCALRSSPSSRPPARSARRPAISCTSHSSSRTLTPLSHPHSFGSSGSTLHFQVWFSTSRPLRVPEVENQTGPSAPE